MPFKRTEFVRLVTVMEDEMYLFQILVPKINKQNKDVLARISKELIKKFGGVTAYSRAPAKGLWEKNSQATVADEITVVEVMSKRLHTDWWKKYKKELEERLQQDEIVIRRSIYTPI